MKLLTTVLSATTFLLHPFIYCTQTILSISSSTPSISPPPHFSTCPWDAILGPNWKDIAEDIAGKPFAEAGGPNRTHLNYFRYFPGDFPRNASDAEITQHLESAARVDRCGPTLPGYDVPQGLLRSFVGAACAGLFPVSGNSYFYPGAGWEQLYWCDGKLMVEIAIEPDEKNYYDKRWVWFTQDLCVAALTKAVDYCEELKWTKGLGYTSVAAYGSIIKLEIYGQNDFDHFNREFGYRRNGSRRDYY